MKRTPTDNPACGSPVTQAEAAPAGGTVVRQCSEPLIARFVSVDIPGHATLQLCEVTVEEVPCDGELGFSDSSSVFMVQIAFLLCLSVCLSVCLFGVNLLNECERRLTSFNGM